MRTFVRTVFAVTVLAAGMLALVSPAHAVPPPPSSGVDGYVWANKPANAEYVADSGYEHNSSGGDIVVTRIETGFYKVRFEGLGDVGGVAQARPYGDGNTGMCSVGTGTFGADEVLAVRCYDTTGAPADMRFTAHFSTRATWAGQFGWFLTDTAVPLAAYTPARYYDSTGDAPSVWRYAKGHYVFTMPTFTASYPTADDDGTWDITPYVGKGAVRCEVHGPNDEHPPPISAYCVDAAGNPADTRFFVSYSHGPNVLGTRPLPRANALLAYGSGDVSTFSVAGYYSSSGVIPTFTRLSTGRYRVTFPGVAVDHGYATAGALGTPFSTCNVVSWATNNVRVDCRNTTTDALEDNIFRVSLTQ